MNSEELATGLKPTIRFHCWASNIAQCSAVLLADLEMSGLAVGKKGYVADTSNIPQGSRKILGPVSTTMGKTATTLGRNHLSQRVSRNGPTAPRFEPMDQTYWTVIRSLHSRTCLHARSVLALLSHGLVDPAWAQWRICHESSTTARFIAETPEMASRYLQYSVVNKYHLANELYRSRHEEAPTKPELDELKRMAEDIQQDLRDAYGHGISSKDYAWSGFGSFRDIEAAVFRNEKWNPRGEYILASERVHSAPKCWRTLSK